MRYSIGFEEDSEQYTIFDIKLRRLIGNGKGRSLILDSHDEALSVVDDLCKRVGA